MAYSPQRGDVEVPLTVFGGLVTDQPAASLPEGVSPSCEDVTFLPGSVDSRPGLQKVFDPPFPDGGPDGFVPTIVYAKTFTTLTGAVENLYLDSNGVLYWEDIDDNPGVPVAIGNFTPGSWAKSITAFGREYIAISDTLHGADVPLQWDGTNLDRVTQDGPGSPPTVASLALPSVGLAVIGGSGPTVDSITTTDLVNGYYTTLEIVFTAPVSLPIGTPITVSGNTNVNFNSYLSGVSTIVDSVTVKLGGFYFATLETGTGGIATGTGAVTLARANNIVTVGTSAPHNLKVGYQSQIAGAPTAVFGSADWQSGASLTNIVINNEDLPGIATVKTSDPHGLSPGVLVNLKSVAAVTVGTAITGVTWAGGIATVTTSADHGLVPGAVVSIAATGGAAAFFNLTATVLTVVSSKIFTYALASAVTALPAAATGGTVSLNWPIPDTVTPTFFEVLQCPTDDTFQIAITYSNGTWTTGTLQFPWDGTFFVSAVISATVFQYQQNGPPAGSTSTSGTVTPWGQAAPGLHQCQVLFLTRQGTITKGSPPFKVTANGGQYYAVSNIAIGPSNVVARILAFTGANGAYFFYIPSPAQINGQIVSTSTQINDNTTTSAVFDFSDNTLFASLGISIPGNNVAAQIVIEGALGFGLYGSRLVTWGQRNRIQNLLNMGFDGGYLPSAATLPTGWTATGGSLAAGHQGTGWKASGAGSLIQSFYQDAGGIPIATPATTYSFRAWVQGAGTTLTATISSASSGFSSTVTLNGTAPGSFSQADFSATMPSPIPSDMILTLTWTGTPLIDELSIIYQANPYLDTVMYFSYADNPEAFDGVTGKLRSTEDQHKIMDLAEIRQTGYFLTQDPGGRLQQFTDNGITEPSGWNVFQVAANCGLVSAFGLTKSQADDSSASGGEEWFAWASMTGARIFGGEKPAKISQEIQPTWDHYMTAALQPGIQSTWALNDPGQRIIYFGMPGTAAPINVLTLSYRQLDSAEAIANAAPIRIGISGKLIATDHARKWAPWNVQANGAALMVRFSGPLQVVLFGGNAQLVGSAPGYGNVYLLNPLYLTDDDYGQIIPSYVTSFLPGHESEQAAGLSGYRKLLVYVSAYVAGAGLMKVTPYVDTLSVAWHVTVQRPLASIPTYDMEFAGCSAQGNRIALKFTSLPNEPVTGSATDNRFSLQRMTAFVRKAKLPVRGAA